jgi:radical SAM superfamily enzyme YgiQ (UPF0313 family)
MPLGPAYVAAAVEATGRSICVVDAVAEAPTQETLYFKGYLLGLRPEEIIDRIPSDVTTIGISVIFSYEWPAVARIISLIKKSRPGITVILGGEHVTSLPEFCLASSKADVAVMGEGEETIVELLDALDDGRSLLSVDGLAFREGQEIKVNKRRKRRKDIDSIVRPAWHLFDLESYNKHGFLGGLKVSTFSISILGTRGCPYQCTYCSAPNMWEPSWIARDPVKVADEIEFYIEKYGARNFPFQDLTAIIKKSWIIAFCDELLSRNLNITWQLPTGTRLEAIDFEVAEKLKKTGMVNLAYAPESGSEITRNLIKKKMKTEDLLSSIKASAQAKLNVAVFAVVGFPHDTPEHLKASVPFFGDIKKMGATDLAINYFMAMPGTELFYSLYDSDHIKIDKAYFGHILQGLAIWPDVSYCSRMSRWDLAKWKVRMYWSFYSARNAEGGLFSAILRALKGLSAKAHESRLQDAFANFLSSVVSTVSVRFKPYWIPREEEALLFQGWDGIYRKIRHQNIEKGVVNLAPSDTAEIYKLNVIDTLRPLHETPRTHIV